MANNGFPQDWMTELKQRNNIVDVISRYVRLNKKGKNHIGLCPFHMEKTPSFSVNEEEQFYHCFGCKEGGDVIKFIEKTEGLAFFDAIKLLAENCGMKLPEIISSDELIQKARKKEKILNILDETNKYYISNLQKNQAAAARDYITRRNISKKYLDIFQIGYSADWNGLVEHLKKLGYTLEEQQEAGVIDVKDGRAYDAMAERLTFPLFDTYGNCIGFSARILVKSDFAKYKNTADTAVFNKSKTVYGLNLFKKYKTEKGFKEIIIVEGQIDVISMHQAGFENTVACLGSAFTDEHAKELKRFTDTVILCFDGDEAGKKAAWRAIDILKKFGINVFAAMLPSNLKDPDEILKSAGKDKMLAIINEKLPATDYKLISLSKDFNLDSMHEKTKYISLALDVLKSLETETEQEIYLRLLSKITNVSFDSLKRDLNLNKNSKKIEINNFKAKDFPERNAEYDGKNESLNFILAALVFRQPYAYMPEDIENFSDNNQYKILIDYLKQDYMSGDRKIGSIFELFDGEENILSEIISQYNFDNIIDGKKHFQTCVRQLQESSLKQRQKILLEEYKNEKDIEKRNELLKQIQKIAEEQEKNNWRN